MDNFTNLDNIQDSIANLRKHLEDADSLISDLEHELDREGVYHYVDSAMQDITATYNELLQQIETLEKDLEDVTTCE